VEQLSYETFVAHEECPRPKVLTERENSRKV
jgi:hypothetical protein